MRQEKQNLEQIERKLQFEKLKLEIDMDHKQNELRFITNGMLLKLKRY